MAGPGATSTSAGLSCLLFIPLFCLFSVILLFFFSPVDSTAVAITTSAEVAKTEEKFETRDWTTVAQPTLIPGGRRGGRRGGGRRSGGKRKKEKSRKERWRERNTMGEEEVLRTRAAGTRPRFDGLLQRRLCYHGNTDARKCLFFISEIELLT